jgi:hypothetical protein
MARILNLLLTHIRMSTATIDSSVENTGGVYLSGVLIRRSYTTFDAGWSAEY